MILVDDTGENRIVLAPGANLELRIADIEAANALIAQARLLVVQLEVPMEVVVQAVACATTRRGAGSAEPGAGR